jgi:hypothetical protein
VRGVVACVSENETVCRGRERGAPYRQSDGLSQQFLKKIDVWSQHAHRVPNRCAPRHTSVVLHVCTVTCTQFYPQVLHWKNISTQFSPRVLILASTIYSLLSSSGWSIESQQMGLSYLIESFHVQKKSKNKIIVPPTHGVLLRDLPHI